MKTRGAVWLPARVRRAIVAHARRDAPGECCGLLVGAGRRVRFALPMANVAERAAAEFRIDDAQHIEARRWLRRLVPSVEIVGVYHSHPCGTARPSPRDLAEAHYPEWISVIVGLAGARAQIGAFEIADGRARQLRVKRPASRPHTEPTR